VTTIIALMGPAGSGKSTAADYLVERYDAVRYSFAGPLKEVAMRTLSFTREQLWGTQAQKEADDPRYGFSPRWFLQRLGTEGCRAVFGENFWIDQCIAKILREAPALAVIDDARFVNEAKAVRAVTAPARGQVWVLESPGCATVSTDDGSHRSEQEWQVAPADYRIRPPERSIPLLRGAIDALMEHDAKLAALFGRPTTWPALHAVDATTERCSVAACGGKCGRPFSPRDPQVGDRVRITKVDDGTAREGLCGNEAELICIDLPYEVRLKDGWTDWVRAVEVLPASAE